MTVKLYEGCWGVTRGGEKRGPMPEKCLAIYCYPFSLNGVGWEEDGRRGPEEDPLDIIAVFATEAEADAYLAGETDPVAAEIQRDMMTHFDYPAPPATKPIKLAPADEALSAALDMLASERAPKPVTWPDGVSQIGLSIGFDIIIGNEGDIGVLSPEIDRDHAQFIAPTEARQFAALLLAAADKVEGRG